MMIRKNLSFLRRLQTAIIIIYFLLMMTHMLDSAQQITKVMSADSNSTTKSLTIMKQTRSVSSQKQQPDIGDVRKIFTQIRNARKDMKKQANKTRKFYSNVHPVTSGIFTYEWLPKDHLHWFDTKVRHFDKHKKVSVLFPVLYESLKTFLETFCEMLKFDPENQHVAHNKVHKKRVKILRRIVGHLNVTYVELNADMSTLQLNPEPMVNLTRVQKGTNWDPKPNYTTMMVQDWGVITTYHQFLKDWADITRNIYEEFCKEYQKGHVCHDFLNKNPPLR